MPVACPITDDDSAVAALGALAITPVGQPRGKGKWQPVHVETTNIMITAGYAGKQSQSVPCIWYDMGKSKYRFVHLNKNAKWFLWCVGGTKVAKGDLAHVTVLDQLRDSYFGSERPEGDDDDKVDSAVADESQDDPMSGLDSIVEQPQKGQTKHRRGIETGGLRQDGTCHTHDAQATSLCQCRAREDSSGPSLETG